MQYISNSAYKPFLGHTEYAGVDKIRIQYPLDVEYSDGSSDLFTKHGVHKTLSRGGELQYARGSIHQGLWTPMAPHSVNQTR